MGEPSQPGDTPEAWQPPPTGHPRPYATKTGSATDRKGPRYTGFVTAAVFGSAFAYIGLRDPHAGGFGFPPCPFHLVTGWYCPGCGGLRMTHDVLNGDFAAAVVDNAFMLVSLPLLALWLFLRWRSKRRLMPPLALVTMVVAAVVWTVVRNFPGFPLVPTLIAG